MSGALPSRTFNRSEDLAPYLDNVRTITTEVWIRYAFLLHGRMEYEDLYHFGVIGLLRARMQWKPEKGAKFWTYAEFVVRGYLIDSIRSDHVIPMTRPDRIDKHGNFIRGRLKPDLVPIPDFDYKEFAYVDKYKDPMLRNLIGRLLTEREALILHLHYFEDETMTAIGDVFGVTEARISQILKDVLRRLRSASEWHERAAA